MIGNCVAILMYEGRKILKITYKGETYGMCLGSDEVGSLKTMLEHIGYEQKVYEGR